MNPDKDWIQREQENANRKMVDDIYERLMKEEAQLVLRQMGEELLQLNDRPAELSEVHRRKMEKIFARERWRTRRRKLARSGRWAAVFMAALLIASAVTIGSVEAVRIKFLNFIFDVTPAYTEIRFGEEEVSGTYANDKIKLEYIPAGMIMKKEKFFRNRMYVKFSDEENYFIFSRFPLEGIVQIDTEDGESQKLRIKGNKAIYTIKEDRGTLTWTDGEYHYMMEGTIEKDEMIKIAESVVNLDA